jgi:ketosteroid isomerase-like protein
MLKRTTLFGAALIATTACSPKAPENAAKSADTAVTAVSDSAEEANLRTFSLSWFDKYNKQDVDGVANMYADDGMILAPGVAAAVGKAAIHTFLTGDIAGTKKAGLTDVAGDINGSGISGDIGWVSGAYSMTDAAGKKVDSGKYTTLFKKTGTEWKIIRDTWNSDIPAAPATPPKA